MMDCRAMSTPLVTNWRKIDAIDLETVDPTIYRQLIGSLMYLANTMPDIVEILRSYEAAIYGLSLTLVWL